MCSREPGVHRAHVCSSRAAGTADAHLLGGGLGVQAAVGALALGARAARRLAVALELEAFALGTNDGDPRTRLLARVPLPVAVARRWALAARKSASSIAARFARA
jgi:hypothetical protein